MELGSAIQIDGTGFGNGTQSVPALFSFFLCLPFLILLFFCVVLSLLAAWCEGERGQRENSWESTAAEFWPHLRHPPLISPPQRTPGRSPPPPPLKPDPLLVTSRVRRRGTPAPWRLASGREPPAASALCRWTVPLPSSVGRGWGRRWRVCRPFPASTL